MEISEPDTSENTAPTPQIWAAGQKGKSKRDKLLLKSIGFDQIIDWRANGAQVEEICLKLIPELTGEASGISSFILYLMINKWEKDGKERWRQAGVIAATLKAEEAGSLLDREAEKGLMLTSEAVQLAKARSQQRQWQAAKLDPQTYGDAKGDTAVQNITIGTLHLTALQRRTKARQRVLPTPDPDRVSNDQPEAITSNPDDVAEADYEILEKSDLI